MDKGDDDKIDKEIKIRASIEVKKQKRMVQLFVNSARRD